MEPKLFFLGLLFIGLLNAIVVSGDGGVSFAKNKSAEMCSDPRVSEVFICVDNTVKVVWAESEKGTTFYAPTGKITDCPPVALGQASAECVRFSMPNYCTKKVECEKKPEVENINKNETAYENITEKPSEEKPAEEKPKEEKPSGGGSTLDNKPVVIPYAGSTQQQASATGDIFSSPVIIVLAAMVVLLIALYFVFKKTVRPS